MKNMSIVNSLKTKLFPAYSKLCNSRVLCVGLVFLVNLKIQKYLISRAPDYRKDMTKSIWLAAGMGRLRCHIVMYFNTSSVTKCHLKLFFALVFTSFHICIPLSCWLVSWIKQGLILLVLMLIANCVKTNACFDVIKSSIKTQWWSLSNVKAENIQVNQK